MAARARRQPGLIFTLLLGLALSGTVCARADIVFLLQQPGRGEPAFFELAAEHYRAQASVVLVVNSARSLLQVRELLQRSPLRGPEPWGNIVLVAHGSRWTGLSLPIFDDEGIPEPGVWRRVRERGEFVPLSDEVADAETRLRVDSCGLGARPDLLRELAALLGGEPRLKVEAAVDRVEFRQDPQHPNIPPTRHELAYGAKVRPRSYALPPCAWAPMEAASCRSSSGSPCCRRAIAMTSTSPDCCAAARPWPTHCARLRLAPPRLAFRHG